MFFFFYHKKREQKKRKKKRDYYYYKSIDYMQKKEKGQMENRDQKGGEDMKKKRL